jgi:hypothetical protein
MRNFLLRLGKVYGPPNPVRNANDHPTIEGHLTLLTFYLAQRPLVERSTLQLLSLSVELVQRLSINVSFEKFGCKKFS